MNQFPVEKTVPIVDNIDLDWYLKTTVPTNGYSLNASRLRAVALMPAMNITAHINVIIPTKLRLLPVLSTAEYWNNTKAAAKMSAVQVQKVAEPALLEAFPDSALILSAISEPPV